MWICFMVFHSLLNIFVLWKKFSIFTSFLSDASLAKNNQVDRCFWELCCFICVPLRASLGSSQRFCLDTWTDFLLLAPYLFTHGKKASGYHWAQIKLRLLTLLQELFIFFSRISHILFVYCKFFLSIHKFPFCILNQFPKGFVGK
jgi:hypothetical protein